MNFYEFLLRRILMDFYLNFNKFLKFFNFKIIIFNKIPSLSVNSHPPPPSSSEKQQSWNYGKAQWMKAWCGRWRAITSKWMRKEGKCKMCLRGVGKTKKVRENNLENRKLHSMETWEHHTAKESVWKVAVWEV